MTEQVGRAGVGVYAPLLVAIVVTIIAIIGAVMNSGEAGVLGLLSGALWVLVIGVAIWFFIEFGCIRGTIGPNRFGPDPVIERMATSDGTGAAWRSPPRMLSDQPISGRGGQQELSPPPPKSPPPPPPSSPPPPPP